MSPTIVQPVSPAAGYIGGKRNLARRLTAIIDQVPHDCYDEPFVGMGGIFLRRTRKPRAEAINDISGDVATFFRVLQEHYPYFIDMMRWRVASRAEFERLRALPGDRLTDLQRAARFLYLQRLAFGGKVEGRHFGVDRRNGSRFNIAKLEPMLAERRPTNTRRSRCSLSLRSTTSSLPNRTCTPSDAPPAYTASAASAPARRARSISAAARSWACWAESIEKWTLRYQERPI